MLIFSFHTLIVSVFEQLIGKFFSHSKCLLLHGMILVLLVSCTEPVPNSYGFDKAVRLSHPEVMGIRLFPSDNSAHVLRDSILVVCNEEFELDDILRFYNLNTLSPTGKPQRFSSLHSGLREFTIGNVSDSIDISIWGGHHYKTVPLDMLLKGELPEEDIAYDWGYDIHWSNYVISGTDSVIVPLSGYFDETIWNPEDPLPFAKRNRTPVSMHIHYRPESAHCPQLFRNPKTGDIWLAERNRDRIWIFDDDLNIKEQVVLGDSLTPVYLPDPRHRLVHGEFVVFEEGKHYEAFESCFLTSRYIYLSYVGTDTFDEEKPMGVHVLRFDYDGRRVCDYVLDERITSISVDSDDRYLYGLHKTSEHKTELWKYKLK